MCLYINYGAHTFGSRLVVVLVDKEVVKVDVTTCSAIRQASIEATPTATSGEHGCGTKDGTS